MVILNDAGVFEMRLLSDAEALRILTAEKIHRKHFDLDEGSETWRRKFSECVRKQLDPHERSGIWRHVSWRTSRGPGHWKDWSQKARDTINIRSHFHAYHPGNKEINSTLRIWSSLKKKKKRIRGEFKCQEESQKRKVFLQLRIPFVEYNLGHGIIQEEVPGSL